MVNQIKMKKKNYLSKMDDKLLTKILKPVMVQACWIKIVTTLLATKIQRIGLLTQRRYFLKRGGTSNGRQIYNSEYGLQCLELYRSRFITSARAVVPGGSFESFIFFALFGGSTYYYLSLKGRNDRDRPHWWSMLLIY